MKHGLPRRKTRGGIDYHPTNFLYYSVIVHSIARRSVDRANARSSIQLSPEVPLILIGAALETVHVWSSSPLLEGRKVPLPDSKG
jgi:hypothetical protein